MRGALEHGVPALIIPQAAEQYRNARWLADHGLGLMLMPEDATTTAVLDAVRALRSDTGVRTRVDAARQAWLAMPAPEHALSDIDRWIARAGLGAAIA
jgi:UDP:flavonoid glycosyltransferase YjiC (YdhE family)